MIVSGFLVTADGDITVQAASVNMYTSDMYQVQPVSSLGTLYYAASYVDLQAGTGHIQGPSQVAVIAAHDDTTVTISKPQRLGAKLSTFKLKKYQTYNVSCLKNKLSTQHV